MKLYLIYFRINEMALRAPLIKNLYYTIMNGIKKNIQRVPERSITDPLLVVTWQSDDRSEVILGHSCFGTQIN